MQQNGYQNDYLANVQEITHFQRAFDRYPYLMNEEIAPVATAFDNLFSTIETRETEKGIELREPVQDWETGLDTLGNEDDNNSNWSTVNEPERKYKQLSIDFSPAKGTPAQDNSVPSGLQNATVRTRMAATGSLRSSSLYVRSPGEAASLLASIRKSSQENIYILTTDKDDKIIKLHRYAKGSKTATPVDLVELAGQVLNTPGATRAYVVHNHPSAKTFPSPEDHASMTAISEALNLADIETVPLIIGGTKWRRVLHDATEHQIHPSLRKEVVPIKERFFAMNKPGESVSSSYEAIQVKNKLFGDQSNGFLLLNSKNSVVGFLEYPQGKPMAAGAVDLIRALERTNAGAVIFFSEQPLSGDGRNRDQFIKRITSAFGKSFIIHDVIVKGRSLRDHGELSTITTEQALGEQPLGAAYDSLKSGETLLRIPEQDAAGGIESGRGYERADGRALAAESVERIQALADQVQQWMKAAGLPQEVVDLVHVDLKPVIELKGKNVEQTLREWEAEGKSVSDVLGATTVRKWSALMELSLAQNLRSLEKTAFHESFHVAAKWLLPEAEYRKIMQHYKTEEGAAEAFADFMARRGSAASALTGRSQFGVAQRAFEALRKLFKQVGDFLRGKGWARPEDIFGSLAAGEYAPHFGREADVAAKETLFSINNTKPWPENFPNAVVHTSIHKMYAHPDYDAAKNGSDWDAADRLAADLVNPEKCKELARRYPNAFLVPVRELEAKGDNQIPLAMAEAISSYSGLPVSRDIYNARKAERTKKGMLERLLNRPVFTGEVKRGQEYIIVDDAAAQGGTLSELRHYIDNAGGRVVAITTLGAGRFSTVVAPNTSTLEKLEAKHGRQTTENFLREHDIAGKLEALTQAEARFITSFASLDALRNSIAQAKHDRSIGVLQTEKRGEEGSGGAETEELDPPQATPYESQSPEEDHDIFTEDLPKTQLRTQRDIASEILPEAAAERYKAAQGLGRPKLLDVVREKAKTAVATFTPGRMFPKLTNKDFGRENVLLREFMEAGDYGRARAIMELKDILDPRHLDKEDYQLFGLKVVLADMQRDMEPGGVLEAWREIVAAEGELAFGFKDKGEVDMALAKVDAELEKRPAAAAVIERRQKVMAELREQLVNEKMLPEQVKSDDRYFHHQVLEYANAKRGAGVEAGEVRVRKAGWQYGRSGSIKEYNTKYLEAEFEVLAQGYERLARKQVLDEIGRWLRERGPTVASMRPEQMGSGKGGCSQIRSMPKPQLQ